MENDPLAAYLDALARDDCYRVQRVLKQSSHEITEMVYFVGANEAQLGPFVRKRISCDAEMGKGYYHLLEAQRTGRRFLHLPRVYDVHRRDDELVVVMEFVAGRTLRDEVFACDPSFGLAVRWFPLLCDGVTEMHSLAPSPLIHRDLKPDNVLVSESQLTVVDFGIARPYRDGADSDTTHFGTRSYAPPEQFGYGQTDVRSDVYALGMILYFLLTEQEPSPAVVRAGFADPRVLPPLRDVLVRACAFDPAARFQSVQDLKEAFLGAVQAEGAHGGEVVSGGIASQPATPLGGAPTPSVAPFGSASTGASVPPASPAGAPACATAPAASSADAPFQSRMSPASAPAPTFEPHANAFAQTPTSAAPSAKGGALSTVSRASIGLGMVWNVVVLLVWGLFMLASALAVVNPNENDRQLPIWFLFMEYIGFFWPFFSGIAYALTDKRWLRRHVSFMKNQTFKKGLILGLKLAAVGCAILMVCIILAATGAVILPNATG